MLGAPNAAPGNEASMSDPIAAARADGRTLLTEVESKQLLHDAGIRVTRARLATSAGEAAAAAEEIGYPAVLKVVSGDIPHKSDVGGVELGLADAEAVRAAYGRIMDAVRASAPDVLYPQSDHIINTHTN